GQPVDQAEGTGPQVADGPAGQEQVERLGTFYDPGQAGDPSPCRDQAEMDLRQPRLQWGGRGQGNAAPTGPGQLEPTAKACAVHDRDGGKPERRQPVDRREPATDEVLDLGGRLAPRHRVQVDPRAEAARLAAPDDAAAEGSVRLEVREV